MTTRRDILRAAAALTLAREPLERALQEPEPLRSSYDLATNVNYLNHASIGTVPRPVRQALEGYLRACESNPWLHVWGDRWSEDLERAHEACAAAMGCAPDDLAVTRNTTEGFSLLAQGLAGLEGGAVAFTQLNHVGASACWEHQSGRRGFRVQRLTIDERDLVSMSPEELVRAHVQPLDEDVRVLVLPHVDNVLGLRHPIPALAAAARERGVRWVLVDAAQSIGMLPDRADELGADAVATSAHKWLQAPKGTGLLYLSPALREHLSPMVVSWGQRRWAGTARAFSDYGTRDLPTLLCLADAARFQKERAGRRRTAHDRALFEHARARCDAHAGLEWRSPREFEQGAALYGVGLRGTAASDLATHLYEQHGIVLRPFSRPAGEHLRLSPNTLNTRAELDACFDAIEARLG